MAKNNLFTWKRSDSLGSRGKRSNTEVQAWIKRMQTESENATIDAYGDVIPGMDEIGVLQPDDQAIYEAQELLDKWMQDKHLSNLNMEMEFKDEKWATSVKPVLNANDDDINSDFYSLSEDGHILTHKPSDIYTTNSRDYDDIDIDYEEEANKMFRKFMTNTNVETAVMSDLGMDKVTRKFRDPRPKMEQRHQMVKERNKERKEKMKNVQREKMMKREAEVMARKKIQEEEKSKKMKKQMEDAAIQRQMAVIRKEMEEEKARTKEEEERKKKALKEAEEQIKLEWRQKQIMKREEEERRKIAEEKMRRQIRIEMEEKTIHEAAQNMRILHKYFSAWYSLVVDHRVKVGKARAMFDWRCKLRAWNAWRAFINHIKSCKEAEEIAASMKIKYRKEQMAINHFKLKSQRKYFINWHSWVKEQQRLKEIKRDQERNAMRMAAFLDAAASGKLWKNNDKVKESTRSLHMEDRNIQRSVRKEDVADKIDEIFQSEGRQVKPDLQNSKKKRPLSITLNKQELLKESADRMKKLNEKSKIENANEIFNYDTKRESQCDCKENNDRIEKQSNINKGERGAIHAHKREDITNLEGIVNNRTSGSRGKSEVTELDLDDIDSDSVASSVSREDSNTKRCKEELVSRKATVKSERPVTKPVLLPMEARAKQRAEKKAILEERRKREDEQKLTQLKLEQEKLMLAEMEMKKEKMRKKKEEERLQKEAEIAKKNRQEEFKAMCFIADEHYRLSVIRRFGLYPWKNLIEISRLNEQIAVTYHARTVFKKVVTAWKDFADESKKEKQYIADECYRMILLKRCLNGWKKYGKHYDILEVMARKHFASVLLKKYFQSWQYYVTNERLAFWANEEKAEDHDERRILKSSFAQWKTFIANLKEERHRDKRKDEMRKRVREWLPDFLA